jgi:hypothetical protein
MANDNSPIIIPLSADVTDLLKNLAKAGKEAGKTESDIDKLLLKLKELSSAGGSNIVINVSADTSQAENRIKNLDSVVGDVDITVTADTATAESDIENIADNIPSPTVQVTADIAPAESNIKGLDSSAPKVEVQITADDSDAQKALDDIKSELSTLKTLAVIDLVLNSGGAIATIGNVVKAIPGAGTILAATEAMRLFEAQTGKTGKVYEDAINNVFSMNWGENQSEVAEVAAKLTQAGVAAENLEAATASAFEVISVTGFDATKVIDAQSKLVKNGLVPDYQAAADLITAGFQGGGDQAGDFLDTLNEYSSHFVALGIDGPTALNLITQSLAAGTRDSDKLADSFKELNLKLQEAVGTGAGPTFDALTKLGLFDEAQATVDGTMSGTAFAEAAIAAAETKGTDFDLVEIFGTPIEDFGLDIFKNLDFDAAEAFKIDEGTATDAATTLFDTWDSSLESFKRTVETDLAESFKIGGKPLTEILDGAKDKIQEITALLQSGAGLPEALEIALDAPGLAEDIQRLEASLGNFILDLMSTIASIQEGLNIGDKGAGLRQQVATAGAGQFAFDIQVANPDEISGVIERAVSRGVDPAIISDSLTTATTELIAEGDVERAQALVQTVNALPDAFIKVRGVKDSVFETFDLGIQIDPNATAEEIEAAKAAAIAAYEAQTGKSIVQEGVDLKFTPQLDTTAAHAAVDEAITIIDNGMLNFQKTAAIFTNPLEGIIGAFNTPGGQALTMGAGAESLMAAGSTFGAGSMVDWSDPANAILPPTVVEEAQQATADIATATTTMADTATTDFDSVQTAADETAVGLDTVVVSSENLEVIGGAKIMAFANIANQAAQIATSGWQSFNAALATAQNGVGAGVPMGDGSIAGAYDAILATVDGMEGKAGGGHVTADTPYKVGEQGTEIFVPSSDGSIIDANNTAMIMEALGMIAGMQPNSTSNVSNVTNNFGLSNVFNTQNQAQGVSASAALARQIRSLR